MSRAYFGRVQESRMSREYRPSIIMTWDAAYGPIPGNASNLFSSSSSGSSSRGASSASRSTELSATERAKASMYLPRYPARTTSL
jgi:hypothetical protein